MTHNKKNRRAILILIFFTFLTTTWAQTGPSQSASNGSSDNSATLTRGVQVIKNTDTEFIKNSIKNSTLIGPMPSNVFLSVTLLLQVKNQKSMTETETSINNPNDPAYHKYLKPGEVADNFGPTMEDYQKAIDFIQKNKILIKKKTGDRQMLRMMSSVGTFEKVFHVNINLYKLVDGRICYAPDQAPSIELDIKIASVSGLDNLSRLGTEGTHFIRSIP